MMIQETCGCGASILFEGDQEADPKVEMRLWRKNHQHKPPVPDPEDDSHEGEERTLPQHSEGNNHTQLERAYESDRNHELNNSDRPGHYGRSISLKYHPKEQSCTQ